MSVEAIFQVIETIAVVIAVGFAIVQVRQYRRDKHREAAMELLHAFQTPEFAKALCIVYEMPEGLSENEVRKFAGADFHLVYAMATTWESIGVLVCRGEIDLQLVDDFFSGPIRISWCRLEGFIKAERETNKRDTIFEWFQWLNERLGELESEAPPVPANIEHENWSAKTEWWK